MAAPIIASNSKYNWQALQQNLGKTSTMADGASHSVFEDRRRHHTAAVVVSALCLIIGLPVWWKTTEIYRVSLPFSSIQALTHSKIEYVTEVEVVWAAGQRPEGLLSNLATRLKHDLGSKVHDVLTPKYRVSTRDALGSETDAIEKAQTLTDLRNLVPSMTLTKYNVIIVKQSQLSLPAIGSHNNLFVVCNEPGVASVAHQIAELIREVVREMTLKNKVDASQGIAKHKLDKSSMRSLNSHSSYELAFTLIVPEPQALSVHWDIQQAAHDYLGGLKASLQKYATLTISSQVLYLSSIGGKPKKRENYFYLEEQDLPHIINPLESKLGSHASNSPTLNLIVYIPTQRQNPLHIIDMSDNRVPTNSFLSPRWGGLLIYNWDKSLLNQSQPLRLDMHHVMEIFHSHIRLLLDIPLNNQGGVIPSMETGSSHVQQWELSAWLRCRCIENIVKVSNTLKSLAQLLEQINNIVINDDIGRQVEEAVNCLEKSHKHLLMGELEEAFLWSRRGEAASEKAFFHPSLLENLYFPEDQKFAIYIPLFLPISIPIIMSTLQAVKWFRQNKHTTE